jgi:hypothetical protein
MWTIRTWLLTFLCLQSTFLADLPATAVPVIRHYDAVNKMKARTESFVPGDIEMDTGSKKRPAEDAGEGKSKKAKKAKQTKTKPVVMDDDDEDEEDVVEDFHL